MNARGCVSCTGRRLCTSLRLHSARSQYVQADGDNWSRGELVFYPLSEEVGLYKEGPR